MEVERWRAIVKEHWSEVEAEILAQKRRKNPMWGGSAGGRLALRVMTEATLRERYMINSAVSGAFNDAPDDHIRCCVPRSRNVKETEQMTHKQTIDCFITLGSTYSYLTVMRLPEVQRRSGVSVRFRPFHLGLLFKEMGYFPFPPDSPKTRYMWQDLGRRAQMYDIPARLPAPYPAKQPFVANRVTILGLREGWGDEFIRISYRRWFQEGQEPGSDPNLSESLREIGQDPERVIAVANGEEIERALMSETDAARSLGIFGSPTFVVGDQLFWGDDRLDDAIGWARDHSKAR